MDQVFGAQLPGNAIHLLLCLGKAGSRLQARDNGQPREVARNLPQVAAHGDPEIGVFNLKRFRRQQQFKTLRQDPDYGEKICLDFEWRVPRCRDRRHNGVATTGGSTTPASDHAERLPLP
jgi:hypothetical protein